MGYSERPFTVEEIRNMHLKGAIYIRMSTDLQTDSPAIQEQQIREFAKQYNITIVKVYRDLGISGMTAEAREDFLAMRDDVKSGKNEYKIILYWDESRWGRFVNSSDAEYYRMELERYGVICRPCDKPLSLTNTVADRIMTLLRDESASDYCRQLSQKVFHGQKAKILQGYRQGGIAGYGLRRMLLAETGEPKQELKAGQRKSLQTERVILVPGPEEEQQTVCWIYDQFIAGVWPRQIAAQLNGAGCMNAFGRPWTTSTIKEVLTNEKYIGNNVYNRCSAKMKSKPTPNPKEEWVIKEAAFVPIVDRERFDKVQEIFNERAKKYSNDELLNLLGKLYSEKGKLSAVIIDEADTLPPSSLFRNRFGGLVRAYKLVGYTPERDFEYIAINQRLRNLYKSVVSDTIDKISLLCGRDIYIDPETTLIEINYHLSVSIVISRCYNLSGQRKRWKIRFDTGLKPDITVAVRMDSSNENIQDYYIFPKFLYTHPQLYLMDGSTGLLDTFKVSSLESLFDLSININLDKAVQYAKGQN